MDKQKYRHIIEFLILKKKSPKDIHHELLDTYGDDCPSKTTAYFWCSEIGHGRKSLEDDPRSGRPCTATSPQLCEEILLSVRADRRVTVRRLAEIHGVSKSSTDVILRERLHMKKLCARWVPRLLTLDQKCRLIRLKLPSLQLINVAIGCFHTHPTRLTLHRQTIICLQI